MEEAIAEFTNIIQTAPDDKPLNNIRNTHGKSRTKLKKNEISDEDGR
jgi:hypothetical protein